jgi:ATP phosphoribosyltransferase regulatory subunit
MSRAWLLPEQIADVLPRQARRIEALRHTLLDTARGYGFELVIPPLVEHLESLLSGTGQALDLKTFKLVDQLTGRSLGVRADMTPQVARIDAHLLNRQGVARLSYCGPVLHARADNLLASRELLQFGAEIYGHAGFEADLEVIDLALDALRAAGVAQPVLDMGDARCVDHVLGHDIGQPHLEELMSALAAKDAAAVQALARTPQEAARWQALLSLHGSAEVLDKARALFTDAPAVLVALADLQRMAEHVQREHPQVRVSIDLADTSGYAYYSGLRFAAYAPATQTALCRGGRYDEVGAVFGRRRPAVGFSLDVRALAEASPDGDALPAIRAPWGEDPTLRRVVRQLREQGHTVVCALPGHEHEAQEYACDRELVQAAGRWVVQAI